MKKEDTNPPGKDRLLEVMIENFHVIQRKNISMTKYRQIKEAILESLYTCHPNDRLPSIRTLSRELDVTPVPIQRAITELIAEDLLYSQNGIGLFVKHPPSRNRQLFTGHRTLHKVQDLGFLFYDSSDAKREMMLRIVEKYREANQGETKVKLMFEKPDAEQVDIDLSVHYECFEQYLDLADFSRHEIEKGNLKILGKFGGILYYVSYILFYNIETLKALGIPPPSYKNFKEQKEYISRAKQIMEKNNTMGPVSWNRPEYFLGNHVIKVIEFLKENRSANSREGKKYLRMLKKIIDYYRLFAYDGAGIDGNALECFINADTPIFTADTNCISILNEQSKPAFKWQVYPLFSYDDTLPLQPIYSIVNGSTRLPMECVKFLKYLQGTEAQKEFYESYLVTVQRSGKYLTDNRCSAIAAEKSFSGYLEESVDNYIFEHIIDSELMECQTRNKNIKDAFENIIHYSSGYLRHFSK